MQREGPLSHTHSSTTDSGRQGGMQREGPLSHTHFVLLIAGGREGGMQREGPLSHIHTLQYY